MIESDYLNKNDPDMRSESNSVSSTSHRQRASQTTEGTKLSECDRAIDFESDNPPPVERAMQEESHDPTVSRASHGRRDSKIHWQKNEPCARRLLTYDGISELEKGSNNPKSRIKSIRTRRGGGEDKDSNYLPPPAGKPYYSIHLTT